MSLYLLIQNITKRLIQQAFFFPHNFEQLTNRHKKKVVNLNRIENWIYDVEWRQFLKRTYIFFFFLVPTICWTMTLSGRSHDLLTTTTKTTNKTKLNHKKKSASGLSWRHRMTMRNLIWCQVVLPRALLPTTAC